METRINQLAEWILSSQRTVIFTGAGMSTESGIPDFRSPGGIWSKYEWDERYGPKKWEGIRKASACRSCWNPCGDSLRIKDGEFAGTESRTGTYIWIGVVGQKLELSDNRAAIKMLECMNREGICAVTASSLLDWVTRRHAEGAISDKETEGLTLTRDLDGYLELIGADTQFRGCRVHLNRTTSHTRSFRII